MDREEESSTEPEPVGAIHNTVSNGRLDLVIYDDGILAVTGTYLGVVLRGAGVGMVGVGGAAAAGSGAAAGVARAHGYEGKRLAKLLEQPRRDLLQLSPSHVFFARTDITSLLLRKRWYSHSLAITTMDAPEGRTFRWKPAFNRFSVVEDVLSATFGRLVTRE